MKQYFSVLGIFLFFLFLFLFSCQRDMKKRGAPTSSSKAITKPVAPQTHEPKQKSSVPKILPNSPAPSREMDYKKSLASRGAPLHRARLSKRRARHMDLSRPMADLSEDKGNSLGTGKNEMKPKGPKVWKAKHIQEGAAQVKVGMGKFLQLRSIRVAVKIEGLRVRTMVDHVFYNPFSRRLQGDFKYQLPEQASIAYFAFYSNLHNNREVKIGDSTITLPDLDSKKLYQEPLEKILEKEKTPFGSPKVAKVVPKQKALKAYEEVVRRNIDPGLVEWAGGNAFTTRIFPLNPHSFSRVVLVYDQTLPFIEDMCRYTFHWPKNEKVDIQFTLVSHPQFEGKLNLHGVKVERAPGLLAYRLHKIRKEIKEDLVDYRYPPGKQEVIAGKDQQIQYYYGRLHPNLENIKDGKGASHAIFLLDTSFSQDGQAFELSMALMKKILESNPEIQKFNLLFFHIGSRFWNPKGWVENNPTNRNKLFTELKEVLLEGATDFESAFMALAKTPWIAGEAKNVDIFLLTDGQPTWGDTDLLRIGRKFQKALTYKANIFSYNFGLGNFNPDLSRLIQSLGGSIFNCYGPSQLEKVAKAHKSAAFRVETIEVSGLSDCFFGGGKPNLIYPGQNLIFGGRRKIDEKKGPAQIRIKGTFLGEEKELLFQISEKDLFLESQLAPRAYGELVVKNLESMNNPALERIIIAYARYFSVPGKTCSLLMLESEKDYKEFQIKLTKDAEKIQKESLSKKLQSLLPALKAVFFSEKDLFGQFWEKINSQKLVKWLDKRKIARILGLLSKEDFHFQTKKLVFTKWFFHEVSKTYLQKRKRMPKNVDIYLMEGAKRLARSLGDSLRCLSTIVELDPEKSESLRLVGYWLLQKRLPSLAIGLFKRVRDKRPFEPHSYRDLAKCYSALGKYGVAAMYYEMVLGGQWHRRFGLLKHVVRGEYLRMIRNAFFHKAVKGKLKDFLGERAEFLAQSQGAKLKGDIMVTITWNTDNTDVDLWVKDPNGESCGYNHKRTRIGGRLLQDITRGYGPEQFYLPRAIKGEYEVSVHYFASSRTRLGARSFVEITLTFYGGTPKERSETFYVMLTKAKERVVVSRFSWPPE